MTHVTSNAPEGTPNWIDLGVPDVERAKAFYGPIFGWEFQDTGAETGHYNLCLLRGESVAAVMKNPDENAADFWWDVYFAADDCDATVARVTDAGGEVVEPPMDVMDLGRMAIVRDPQGAQFGLWQGRAHIGSAYVNEPGSLVWNEVVTPDPKAALDFYAAVFGHRGEAMPAEEAGGMDYTVLKRPDGRYIGGVMGEPGAGGASWQSCFAVADADEAVRLVREGGGAVDQEPVDSPYGRFASVRDPFGARFQVMKPAPEPAG